MSSCGEKRKDFTPKKNDDSESRKRLPVHTSMIDLTLDDDDDEVEEICDLKEEPLHASRRLFEIKIKSDPDKKDLEDNDQDLDSHSSGDNHSEKCLPQLSFYRNDQNLPIYSHHSPDLLEIFRICLKKNVPAERLVSQKPVRVKDKVTFVVNQEQAGVKHPKDLDADDIPGAYNKKEQTRFYQVEIDDGGEMKISCEVNVTKNSMGHVISGTYRKRVGNKWVAQCANIENLYAVIRKRAVHKATLERYNTAFTRCIVWVMPLHEYNATYATLKNKKNYALACSNIILFYYFNTGKPVPIVPQKHGNANQRSSDFRPKEHSFKQKCKELAQNDTRAPRLIYQEIQEDVSILDSFSDSSSVRDPKQISNYKQNYGPSSKSNNVDVIRDIIFELLEQCNESDPSVLNKNQAFIQEMLMRHGKQVGIVAYLQQTLKDLERFCTNKANMSLTSPLCADTTFNIAEYLVTQTTYKQLSLIKRDDLKHPWFPGPILFHRNQKQQDFAYFWQAVKRGNPALSELLVLGTDEDTALSGGILNETTGNTIHLLGKEHVLANVEKKLVALNFPLPQRKIILHDIFGGPNQINKDCLYECESKEDFDQQVRTFKTKWSAMEREYTRNTPPNKFVTYFEVYKKNQVRDKMIKMVRRRAHIEGEYGQNPIEWLNFLSKEEIDAHAQGKSHRDVSLTTALTALKYRYLRLYENLVKAIYDEGPYMLSPAFSHLCMSYDEWKDMSRDSRTQHIKVLLNYVPTPAVMRRLTSSSLPANDAELDEHDPKPDAQHQKTTSNHPRHLLFTAEEANIPTEAVPLLNLQDIFRKAELLLNEPGAIMTAASNEERMRTVKSRYGIDPLIVKPQVKSKNLFECTCKVYHGMGICADTIAVAEDNGVLFEYVDALKKKFQRQHRTPNVTTAIESGRNAGLRGHKPNEVQKTARNKSCTRQESVSVNLQERATQLAPPGHSQSIPAVPTRQESVSVNLQERAAQLAPPGHSQSIPAVPNTNAVNNFPSSLGYGLQQNTAYNHMPPSMGPRLQNCYIPQSPAQPPPATGIYGDTSLPAVFGSQTQMRGPNWHSGMSPAQYELVILPSNVVKCYGCGQKFADKYRRPPHSIVVKHIDRRIRGCDTTGNVFYNQDFTNTYYHLIKEHILKKNPTFNGKVFAKQDIWNTVNHRLLFEAGFHVQPL